MCVCVSTIFVVVRFEISSEFKTIVSVKQNFVVHNVKILPKIKKTLTSASPQLQYNIPDRREISRVSG